LRKAFHLSFRKLHTLEYKIVLSLGLYLDKRIIAKHTQLLTELNTIK